MQMPTQFPVTAHTNYVTLGSTFVAIKGYQDDGMRYIPEAIARGARIIVIQQDAVVPDDIRALIQSSDVTLQVVDNARATLAQLSAQAAGYPSKKLSIVGITGTKGKTTTAFMTYHILKMQGYKTALISSVKNSINGIDFPSNLIPPQPDYLHQFLALCVIHDITHVVMEVAAHAVTMHRIDGIEFDGIVFTNLGLEHLEFYASMDDYFNAKCELLQRRKATAPAVLNLDNEWTRSLLGGQNTYSFSTSTAADLMATNIEETQINQAFMCRDIPVHLPLIGLCNVYNALGAIGLVHYAVGVPFDACCKALQSFNGVPGRWQAYQLPNGALCVIDYAHNPLSYEAVLGPLRERTDDLVVVFGAGGQRDAARRPIMGNIAAKYADKVILTTDNPRTEDPVHIIQDILKGIEQNDAHKVIQELDREQAIHRAYRLSKRGSIIALLGKGPDEYQIVGTTKYPFSEAAIIKAL